MSVLNALEIERCKVCDNGVYVCVNVEKKEFKVVPLEEVSIKVGDKQCKLGDLINLLLESHNTLVDILMTNSQEVK